MGNSHSLSGGLITTIAVASAVAGALGLAVARWCVRRWKKKNTLASMVEGTSGATKEEIAAVVSANLLIQAHRATSKENRKREAYLRAREAAAASRALAGIPAPAEAPPPPPPARADEIQVVVEQPQPPQPPPPPVAEGFWGRGWGRFW